MRKIVDLSTAAKKSVAARRKGCKVGLITGCFDLIHEGHLDLFRFAKEYVDVLIVALDSDKAIRSGKGDGRPIHNQAQRAEALARLKIVDLVLPIEDDYVFTKESVEPVHDKIRDTINPHYLITAPAVDLYWESKKVRANAKGVEVLLLEKIRPISTSALLGVK